MMVFYRLLLITFLIFSLAGQAQIVSHVNAIGGYHFYHYLRGGKGAYSYDVSFSLGTGIGFKPIAKIVMAEYNVIYWVDKMEVNSSIESEGRMSIKDHIIQNQFLIKFRNNKNSLMFRTGICLDFVVYSDTEYGPSSQQGDRYIQVGEGNLFRKTLVNALLGVSMGNRVKLAVDFIPSITSKLYTGEFEELTNPDYYHGDPNSWFKRTMGTISLIWEIPIGKKNVKDSSRPSQVQN